MFKKLNFYVNIEICRVILIINTVTVLSLSPIQYFVLEFEVHLNYRVLFYVSATYGRSQWTRRLRRRSAAARFLRSWVRIPPGAWMFVCCECCVLSGRSLCDELMTRPEESYRLCCVVVCDLETSRKRRPWPRRSATKKNWFPWYFQSNVGRFNFERPSSSRTWPAI